jgi:hypothetical protein
LVAVRGRRVWVISMILLNRSVAVMVVAVVVASEPQSVHVIERIGVPRLRIHLLLKHDTIPCLSRRYQCVLLHQKDVQLEHMLHGALSIEGLVKEGLRDPKK